MSDYTYQTTTNDKPDSRHDVLGHLMPAKAFFFVTVDEVGPEGFLVRKTYTTVHNPHLHTMGLTELQKIREVYPEKSGLWARNPNSLASVAEHVLGSDKVTSYVSTSANFPDGATRFNGVNNEAKTVYVDIAKAKRAGAKLVTPDEIGHAVNSYLKDLPSKERREGLHTLKKSLGVDNEYLVKPAPVVPADGLLSKRGLALMLGLEKWARVVQVFGVFFTGYDIAMAGEESIRIKSYKPIEKSALRQIAGWEGSLGGRWAGAAIGARIGAADGTLCGIELGPGAFITGLVGGLIGGAIGYFGESYILDKAGVN
jgi:hypothetical protein